MLLPFGVQVPRALNAVAQRQAALVARRAGDLLRPRHPLGDRILGELGTVRSYAKHPGMQVNLGDGSQQPVAQISPGAQSFCFLQACRLQMPPACKQTLPPPGFFPQKQVPWHPSPLPPPQVNGSAFTHFKTHTLWTQICPSGQLRLRWQTGSAAPTSRPPSPSSGARAPALSPPSTYRRGSRISALVMVSNRSPSMLRLLCHDGDDRRSLHPLAA